jgi:hypothetical protein
MEATSNSGSAAPADTGPLSVKAAIASRVMKLARRQRTDTTPVSVSQNAAAKKKACGRELTPHA